MQITRFQSNILLMLCACAFTLPAQPPAASTPAPTATPANASAPGGWPTYGGDAGGQRYSTATAIDRTNVAKLHPVWTYHTHALDAHLSGYRSAAFETTPVLFHGLLYLTTQFDKIVALDPGTGQEHWNFAAPTGAIFEGQIITNRGVATWDGGGSGECSARVFIATLGGQLAGVDAATGKPCQDFGHAGIVDVKEGLKPEDQIFSMTSAPTVVGDVIILGSSISDNAEVSMAHGTVRAYDVRSGRQVWTWEPIPWADQQHPRTGAGNAWSTMAADTQTGLVFVPTGSASPDYYGGLRLGDGRDADSMVALDAKTGRKVWAYQVVHHNLWDYDVPSEPLLFLYHGTIPAVAVTTKMGMVFVLDRRTGVPLIPVEERPVPQTDVPGEVTSPTQPFSTLPALAPLNFPLDQVGQDRDQQDGDSCRTQIAGLRYEGIYTPPSRKGSLIYPGAIGGVNWGSAAFDPTTGILYANVNRQPYFVQLMPPVKQFYFPARLAKILLAFFVVLALMLWFSGSRSPALRKLAVAVFVLTVMAAVGLKIYVRKMSPQTSVEDSLKGAFGEDHSPQYQAPFSLFRHPILDSHGLPCTPGTWGTVSALNLETGKMQWEHLHGDMGQGRATGSVSLGGPIVTAGGLVFSAGTKQPIIQAFDAASGKVLWQGDLPAPAQATPMTYQFNGKQFVVIAAGGSALFRTATGDAVVAFSLDQ